MHARQVMKDGTGLYPAAKSLKIKVHVYFGEFRLAYNPVCGLSFHTTVLVKTTGNIPER